MTSGTSFRNGSAFRKPSIGVPLRATETVASRRAWCVYRAAPSSTDSQYAKDAASVSAGAEVLMFTEVWSFAAKTALTFAMAPNSARASVRSNG